MITLDCITDTDGLRVSEAMWNDLLERSHIETNRVFHTFEFAWTWWKHFSDGCQLLVILLRNGGEPVGIIPLVIKRNGTFRQIRLLGDSALDYQDFIMVGDREECVDRLFGFLSEKVTSWDIMSLDNVPQSSANFPFFQKQVRLRGRCVKLERFAMAPYVRTDSEWASYYKSIRKNIRNDTKRQVRRLNEKGRLHFGRCKRGVDISDLMKSMFDFKDQRYVDSGKQRMYRNGKVKDFHLDLALAFWRKGWLDLSYLAVGSDLAAVHFGSVYQNKFYYWLPAFNDEYENFSPGRLLLMKLLEDAFNGDISEFDFGFGEEPYKYDWAKEDRTLYRFQFFNRTARGVLLQEWFQALRTRVRRNRRINTIFKSAERIICE
jgi:CelD/BcsL family acetyltransferase involved in cellulose biosynthesis